MENLAARRAGVSLRAGNMDKNVMIVLEDSGVCAMIRRMAKVEVYRRKVGRRKKRIVPLTKLQTPEVVKTVLRHPRRLEELLDMLGEKDLVLRGRAAATLASLAATRPERLVKVLPRLRECLGDDSDYVRWHLFYAFGELSMRLPAPTREYWCDIFAGMGDGSRVVRLVAGKATARLVAESPDDVAAAYRESRREIPPEIAALLPPTATAQDVLAATVGTTY